MNDIEEILIKLLATLEEQDVTDRERIETQEEVIRNANDVIEQCRLEGDTRKTQRVQFQMLFSALKNKAADDRESLAELFISDRTDDDIETFSGRTGIGLPENESATDEEDDKKAASGTA